MLFKSSILLITHFHFNTFQHKLLPMFNENEIVLMIYIQR